MSIVRLHVISQGHWRIEYTRAIIRRPGLLVIGVGTEEKRPALTQYHLGGRIQAFSIGARDGSIGFRDGEDGSEGTVFELTFPRTLPWRTWTCVVDDWDKYESRIVAYTRNRARWEGLR